MSPPGRDSRDTFHWQRESCIAKRRHWHHSAALSGTSRDPPSPSWSRQFCSPLLRYSPYPPARFVLWCRYSSVRRTSHGSRFVFGEMRAHTPTAGETKLSLPVSRSLLDSVFGMPRSIALQVGEGRGSREGNQLALAVTTLEERWSARNWPHERKKGSKKGRE